jgi:hypothetical protein
LRKLPLAHSPGAPALNSRGTWDYGAPQLSYIPVAHQPRGPRAHDYIIAQGNFGAPLLACFLVVRLDLQPLRHPMVSPRGYRRRRKTRVAGAVRDRQQLVPRRNKRPPAPGLPPPQPRPAAAGRPPGRGH